jgi:hypothetical protein
MKPAKHKSTGIQVWSPLQSPKIAATVLVLSALCFSAAFILGFFGRAGLTQYVSAGLLLAMWASRVATANADTIWIRTIFQKLIRFH